ncbi:MAG TPA: ABC transporter substrate-binding protein [Tissierellaceae bacterium]|nr:ABC transporter substrate-binding protein [Tissierellaceae bacterium]
MKRNFLIVLSLILVLSLVAGCTSSPASNGGGKDGDTIRIGLNFAASGFAATYGQGLTKGIELAFEEINEAGGLFDKKFEAVKFDNKSDDTEAANISTRLATRENVVAMLGSDISGTTKAAIPAAMENKIPLISGSATADDVTIDNNGNVREYVFKTCFNDSFQGVMMAEFAYHELGFLKAAILSDTTSDYAKGLSKSFRETFEGLGGQVLVEEFYQENDTDFRAVLTNINGKDPEVLFVPGYYEEVGLIIRQARELGLDVPILGADGFESPKLVEIAGEGVLNDVFYSSHYSPMDDAEEVVKFREAYKEKYGEDPDAFNALGYDLAYLLKDALERAGEVDSEKLKDALATTENFTGVTGTLSMDEFHNPVKSVTINELKNGEVTFYKKIDPQ